MSAILTKIECVHDAASFLEEMQKMYRIIGKEANLKSEEYPKQYPCVIVGRFEREGETQSVYTCLIYRSDFIKPKTKKRKKNDTQN